MILTSLIAIVGGVLAASSVIIAKSPDSKDIIEKITPYQGWIGLFLLFWGVRSILQLIFHMGAMGSTWLFALAASVVMAIVGFLLGYGLLSKYVLERNETAKEKGKELRQKLIKYQIPAGFTLIVLGIITLFK